MKKKFCIKYFFVFLLLLECFDLPAQDLKVIDSLQNLVATTNQDTTKISAWIELSILYQDNNSDTAFAYVQQAFDLSVKINHKNSLGKSHNKFGDLYLLKGDYGAASDHFFKALKIYEHLKNNEAIAKCYNSIGKIYLSQKNNNDALIYFNKSLLINQKLNIKEGLSTNYTHIGIIYNKLKKYEDAIQSFKSSLKIQMETGNKKNMAANYGNMGISYSLSGKPLHAIESIEKGIKIAEEVGNKKYLANLCGNLGALYAQGNKLDKAIVSFQKALKYAKEVGYKDQIQSLYNNISAIYQETNDFQKSFEYAQLSLSLTDSINSESNYRQANELTSKYESETKELAINNLEKDKALSKEKFESEKNFKIYLLIFSLFIGSFAFVLFRGNVQKRKANIALSFAYEEIELKNKDISDSINYSKRIQDASLAPKELKYKLFPDAFVLFKPKDIVSGDFYWFAEKNGKKLIASCDCTGHGVPGALMSMIGNNILNQIVNEKGITSPDEILNHLHKEVRKALKQEEHDATRDGMDIALISFNSETEIEYAGAQRPLWILKKLENGEKRTEPTMNYTSSEFELSEIKPDKFSIGGHQSEIERKFTKHKILLSKGDCIYIFSDGFVDQFGGKEGKKFMSKRFKDLLLANYSTRMLEQENTLIKTFETWKGSREQVDDLLVIGIRI
ncbi:MAG: tetratricopeptide repeat protein [Bacteroidota bacterium]